MKYIELWQGDCLELMKDISDKLANPPKYRPYYDEEDAHMEMDDLMLDLLRSLGYGDGVDIFENTNKWYA